VDLKNVPILAAIPYVKEVHLKYCIHIQLAYINYKERALIYNKDRGIGRSQSVDEKTDDELENKVEES
jgi:hypothetical protein